MGFLQIGGGRRLGCLKLCHQALPFLGLTSPYSTRSLGPSKNRLGKSRAAGTKAAEVLELNLLFLKRSSVALYKLSKTRRKERWK